MSVVEFHNDRVSDLLRAEDPYKALQVRESWDEGVYIQDLTKRNVADLNAALKVLDDAWRQQKVKQTHMSVSGARCTTIAILETTIHDETGDFQSKHYIVDLFGSEIQGRSGPSCLHQVVASLANPATRHVPYRDSALTFLLRNALGDAMDRTLILGCLSPAARHADMSLATLRFLEHAKSVPCRTRPPRRHAEQLALSLGGAMTKPAASAASRQVVAGEQGDDPGVSGSHGE